MNINRDQQIPIKREIVRERLEKELTNTQGVVGLFYGGSMASGTMDLYSDLDVRVVVEDRHFTLFVGIKKELARKWGHVLFFEDLGDQAPYTIAHYDGFFKVDLFFYKASELEASVWQKDILIVYDPTGIVTAMLDESDRLSYSFTKEDFKRWRGKTLAYVHEAYRRAMRGEWYYAHQCIDSIRWSIANGWLVEKGNVPNAPMDWAKIEGKRSPLSVEQQKRLRKLEHRPDFYHQDRLLGELLRAYLPLEKTLSRITESKVNQEETERIWKMALVGEE
ncbi:nucleotidyltransferase domain-containing protein [Alteribacter aurantiacus]|uniref:nucleotidyltransferase domain-containing protein n=1 Tax=Alteribacter aurantiacus TaxID=254410 RepID=UPI0003F77FBE|nr:nucleotidyltransferase domain-containing protein [Alteribacter aurantiacus]